MSHGAGIGSTRSADFVMPADAGIQLGIDSQDPRLLDPGLRRGDESEYDKWLLEAVV